MPVMGTLSAQPRAVERYALGSVEGRLMGFYSAALAFAPLAPPAPPAPAQHDT